MEVKINGSEPRVLNVTKVPLRVEEKVAGVHMVAKDITVEAASRSIIAQQARRLNTIFESITDAFFLLDRRWTFNFVNSEVERLLGMSRQQLLGNTAWQVFTGQNLDEFYQQCRLAMASGNAVHFQAFFEPRQLWLEVKAFPSEEGLSVYFTDVTDKVKAHQELYRQNTDLQQFAYIVSHNLRAPLANMLGLVDLLVGQEREQRQTPEYEQLLHHLLLNTRQLDTVLHDMNTILTVRDKQGVSEPEQVPLAEVVRQVVDSLRDSLDECGGEIHTEIPAKLCVRGIRAYLYSVFFNLLSNAIKYRSEQRPLRITITATPSQPGPGTQVEVADNGSGFDTQKAGADVFKLYKRFHTQPEGRGLGLYLVKTHVEAMGGRITVHSTVNVGTRFLVHLS
ncbi:HAMP domain-containing histidine kinase [Hymenobacter sp. 5516J-16]|uniref:PAS domain-containing sensor histidine kinase n=1 Tax=Hymenobacter sp. 5516J-16 TaxID=2932253 RepID=UPI001FD56539|nr:HAMP domain-containing sensor histidine kinase [Hymenobacter sp. 5516J-16]UOQ77666.1 HAMP domain-containing histidine kinase [Hymenobacter sp. 5516J-16]